MACAHFSAVIGVSAPTQLPGGKNGAAANELIDDDGVGEIPAPEIIGGGSERSRVGSTGGAGIDVVVVDDDEDGSDSIA